MLGVKHPIVLAGANYLTEPGIVAAVAEAGGFPIFAMAHCTPKEVHDNIREIRARTDKPFGVNQILNGPGARENVAAAIEERVAAVNYSLGKPWFVDAVHAYGGKVIATIAMSKHARKAVELGADALIVTGYEAAAHGAAITSLVLLPIVSKSFDVPIIAAGGYHDGRGAAAALTLGADAISMGTRFMMTRESVVHQRYKDLCLKASEEDTLYDRAFDGIPARVLKSPGSEALMQARGVSVVDWVQSALKVKQMLGLSIPQFVGASFRMIGGEGHRSLLEQARYADSIIKERDAMIHGDPNGYLCVGQDIGAIDDLPSCQELIERTVSEAEAALSRAVGLCGEPALASVL